MEGQNTNMECLTMCVEGFKRREKNTFSLAVSMKEDYRMRDSNWCVSHEEHESNEE